MMVCKKAQIVMSDLIISLGIFLLLMAVAYSAWSRTADQLSQWDEDTKAQIALDQGMIALTQAPGHPSDWALLNVGADSGTIQSLGLVQRPGVLDPVRVDRLAVFLNGDEVSYNNTVKKLGLSPYQVDIRISTPEDQLIVAMGHAPTEGVVSGTARAMAIYPNQTMVQVRLRLWRNDMS